MCSQPGFPTKSDSILFHAFCPFFKTKKKHVGVVHRRGEEGERKGRALKEPWKRMSVRFMGHISPQKDCRW